MVTQTEVELAKRHPGMVPYKECVTRAYAEGVVAFSLAFATTYFGLRSVSTFIHLDWKKYSILAPAVIGSLSSFLITKRRVTVCNDLWQRRRKEELEENEEKEKNQVAISL